MLASTGRRPGDECAEGDRRRRLSAKCQVPQRHDELSPEDRSARVVLCEQLRQLREKLRVCRVERVRVEKWDEQLLHRSETSRTHSSVRLRGENGPAWQFARCVDLAKKPTSPALFSRRKAWWSNRRMSRRERRRGRKKPNSNQGVTCLASVTTPATEAWRLPWSMW